MTGKVKNLKVGTLFDKLDYRDKSVLECLKDHLGEYLEKNFECPGAELSTEKEVKNVISRIESCMVMGELYNYILLDNFQS